MLSTVKLQRVAKKALLLVVKNLLIIRSTTKLIIEAPNASTKNVGMYNSIDIIYER